MFYFPPQSVTCPKALGKNKKNKFPFFFQLLAILKFKYGKYVLVDNSIAFGKTSQLDTTQPLNKWVKVFNVELHLLMWNNKLFVVVLVNFIFGIQRFEKGNLTWLCLPTVNLSKYLTPSTSSSFVITAAAL